MHMREKNAAAGNYLSVPERFAQIYNAAVFHGETIIQSEKLRELDASEKAIFQKWRRELPDPKRTAKSKDSKPKVQEGYRDIIKMYENQTVMLICGIENQDEIHYAMPLRHFLYDALRYHSQWTELKRKHLKDKDLRGAELLSGMAAEERLIPVITLCIYWGTEPWTGPKNLHEMLDIPPDLAQYKHIIGNYPLNLLEVCGIEDLEQYHGELKALLGFVKYQKDYTALQAFMNHNQELFSAMTPETAQAISILGNARNLEPYLSKFASEENGQEEINMCQAIQDMIKNGELIGEERGLRKGREEGRIEGEKVGRIEGGILTLIEDNLEEHIPEGRIIEKLMRRFHLTEQESQSYIKKYGNIIS